MSVYIRYRYDVSRKMNEAAQRAARTRSNLSGPSSQQLMAVETRLRDIALLSTVGVRTLSGISPKSAALEKSARALSDLMTADEQCAGLGAVLDEATTLWSDQQARVITSLVRDIVQHARIGMKASARPEAGNALLEAAIRLAPVLLSGKVVNDSTALEMLSQSMTLLVQQAEYEFSADVFDRLENAGLSGRADMPASAETPLPLQEKIGRYLRNRIIAAEDMDIGAGELTRMVDAAAKLPVHLRGRILTMLINMLSGRLWTRADNTLIVTVGEMVRELPAGCRITPLEAFHNQITLLPHESARLCHPLVSEAVWELPELHETVFDRARHDLVQALHQQGEELAQGGYRPMESLAEFRKRLAT